MKEVRTGTRSLYKGKYMIIFYDKTDTYPVHFFDNVREILKFQCKPITRSNVQLINVELYRALKTETHFCTFLTGEVLRVYIVDVSDED